MPLAPGWAVRNPTAAAVTGTVSLVLPVPSGTQDNDILIMSLSHKGAGFAVVPAGWTLVGQNVSGAVRGEMYWRRANAEPGSYTVTGLATAARGVIMGYTGGLLAGNVVDVALTEVQASGNRKLNLGVTPTNPNELLVVCVASDASGSVTAGTVRDYAASPLIGNDLSTVRFTGRAASSASGIFFSAYDLVKVVPIATGNLASTGGNVAGNHVTIVAALIPDTTTVSAGTRYYLSQKGPAAGMIFGPFQGGWDSLWVSPRSYEQYAPSWELSQLKSNAGIAHSLTSTRNSSAPADVGFGRWCSPPLAAQNISGTIDLTMQLQCFRNDSSAGNPIPSAQYKVHVYVSQGDSTDVRGTLLNQYIDPVLYSSALGTWRSLTAPQALTPVNCQDGDRIWVEIGLHVTVSAPYLTPTRPPSQYAELILTRGAEDPSGSNTGASSVALQDATTGTVNALLCSHVDFSSTITELGSSPPALPNIDCTTATVIPAIPFSVELDTRGVLASDRQVWFQWTPSVSERVILHTLHTGYGVLLRVYDVCPDLNAQTTDIASSNSPTLVFTDGSVVVLDAVAGKTYWIKCSSQPGVATAPVSGGLLRFTITPRIPPANNDVFLASDFFIARYTSDGVLADLSTDFVGQILSGLAIDTTKRPMADLNGGTQAADRLYVTTFGIGGFPATQLFVSALDLATLNIGQQQIDYFDTVDVGGVFATANLNGSSLAINADGLMVAGAFGNGFTFVTEDFRSVLDAQASVNSADLNTVDSTHGDNQPGSPFAPAQVDPATLEAGGTNYLEYAPDGETIFYTSGGWYVPVGGQTVRRFNVVTRQQLTDFATVPIGPGPNPGLKGLFPLPQTPTTPDGGCLVCNGGEVVRLDALGNVVAHYVPSPSGQSLSLADVELQSDGQFFWVLDEASTTLHKFDMATGGLVASVFTGLSYATCTSICIYRIEPFPPPTPPPPPPGTPVNLPPPLLKTGKIHFYGYAQKRPGATLALPLGQAQKARLDIYRSGHLKHQLLGVKVDSSQPLSNPFIADRNAYWSTYVVPEFLDVQFQGSGIDPRYTILDALVLDPRILGLIQSLYTLQQQFFAGASQGSADLTGVRLAGVGVPLGGSLTVGIASVAPVPVPNAVPATLTGSNLSRYMASLLVRVKTEDPLVPVTPTLYTSDGMLVASGTPSASLTGELQVIPITLLTPTTRYSLRVQAGAVNTFVYGIGYLQLTGI